MIDNPCEGDRYRHTFDGQSTHVFQADGEYYLMLDHWKPENLKSSGYSILLINVEGDNLTVEWKEYFEGAKMVI